MGVKLFQTMMFIFGAITRHALEQHTNSLTESFKAVRLLACRCRGVRGHFTEKRKFNKKEEKQHEIGVKRQNMG